MRWGRTAALPGLASILVAVAHLAPPKNAPPWATSSYSGGPVIESRPQPLGLSHHALLCPGSASPASSSTAASPDRRTEASKHHGRVEHHVLDSLRHPLS